MQNAHAKPARGFTLIELLVGAFYEGDQNPGGGNFTGPGCSLDPTLQ